MSQPSLGANHLFPEKFHNGYSMATNIKARGHLDSSKSAVNGAGPTSNGVAGSVPNGVRVMPNGFGAMPNGVGAMSNGARAMSNGAGAMPNGVGTLTNGVGTMSAKPQSMHTAPRSPRREATAKASIVSHALAIISKETAIEITELSEDALFPELGIDSLMSLVLAQKFRSEIGIDVRDSLFVEFPTIGHLCQWLEKS
jgi:acyl carrier protein